MTIKLNPRQASPTIRHRKKKKKVNSIKFFNRNIKTNLMLIIENISKIKSINLICECNFDREITLIEYQIKNIISIDPPLNNKKISNK